MKCVVIFAVILFVSVVSAIIDGDTVKSVEQFPHHVTIHAVDRSGRERYCSGSIMTDEWILSSVRCVGDGVQFRLDFRRLNLNQTVESFSISIDNSQVHEFPSFRHDLALIQLPVKLQFSSVLKPVRLYTDPKGFLDHKYAVMPGFPRNQDRLTYGRFEIITNADCNATYGGLFDENLQICTQGWRNSTEVPCEGNEGGGLLVDWPFETTLIGVFSTPLSCLSRIPAIYNKVPKFMGWITEMTGYSD